jgi:4-carboxymuconolactone decarboxylase
LGQLVAESRLSHNAPGMAGCIPELLAPTLGPTFGNRRETMTKFPYNETDYFKAGRDVWFEMRGPKVAQAAVDQAAEHEMTRDLRQFLFEHCFGAVWARPGLERATRSTITISVLTALGRAEELKSHIRMGLNNGLTREELKEIFLHVGVYAGVPTAVAAVRAAMEVFAEIDGAAPPKG